MILPRSKMQVSDEATSYLAQLRAMEAEIRDRVFYLFHEPRRNTPDLMVELAAIGRLAEMWTEASNIARTENELLPTPLECPKPSSGGSHG